MREIKFRAWDSWNKKMVYQSNDHFVTNELGNIGYDYCEEGGGGVDWKDKENISLMQFTGLKDMNGVEIYEGDIIKNCDGEHLIEFREDTCAFCIKSLRDVNYG